TASTANENYGDEWQQIRCNSHAPPTEKTADSFAKIQPIEKPARSLNASLAQATAPNNLVKGPPLHLEHLAWAQTAKPSQQWEATTIRGYYAVKDNEKPTLPQWAPKVRPVTRESREDSNDVRRLQQLQQPQQWVQIPPDSAPKANLPIAKYSSVAARITNQQ